ncbi:hypothetical protein JTE90_012735 [Oedothorax gibbosus]|uniref:Uncharacterized protein n=1 Tax=Oedothorax gibbosus TaxID=931172 RepID=A0AAV6W2S4_9ARAC|nr:hypothetical protein JTE90_012735 [Oedothorax gibbosus]
MHLEIGYIAPFYAKPSPPYSYPHGGMLRHPFYDSGQRDWNDHFQIGSPEDSRRVSRGPSEVRIFKEGIRG